MIPRTAETLVWWIGLGLLASSALAQETNCCLPPPPTRLEAIETNTGVVLIRATAQVGTVAANSGALSVRCRELNDTSTGTREYGLALGWGETGEAPDQSLVDYEELDSLLLALDYLNKVDWSVTSLPGFDAFYTTRSGLRIAAFGSRRTGTIEFALRNTRLGKAPVLLTRDQVGQLKSLVEQGKAKLESIGAAKK